MDIIELEYDFSQLNIMKNLFSEFGIMSAKILPNTSKSVAKAARLVTNIWNDYYAGKGELEGLPPIEKPFNGKVSAKSISAFRQEISTTEPKAIKLQEGENPVYYDMKKTHPYGRKSRLSKDNVPYLIIPFRWGTPNNKGTKRRWNNYIPQEAYSTNIKGLIASAINAQKRYQQKNAQGEKIEREGYDWGERLTKETAFNSNSVGMVRMKDNSKSTYFTFRVISAKSPIGSWLYWKDGKDAVNVLSALEKTVRPMIETIIESGIRQDLGL